MINATMKEYQYYTYGARDEYGQPQLSAEPTGTVKMAIGLITENVSGNILYTDAQYIGLTHNTKVDNTYVIEKDKERLKVLYVNSIGRWRQVYMQKVN